MASTSLHILAEELATGGDVPAFPVDAGRPLVMLVSRDARRARAAAATVLREWAGSDPGAAVVVAPPACSWPFRYPLSPPLGHGPVVLWAPEMHQAFINHQAEGTHLVTTQAGYQAAEWQAALEAHGSARLLATADFESLREHAPDALARCGAWRHAAVIQVDATDEASAVDAASSSTDAPVDRSILAQAFRASTAAERLRLSVRALEAGRTAPALVATASVCMEVNDLEAARRDLDEAVAAAPNWAAAHFERGKLLLRTDDMAGAADAFQKAALALPGFGPAWANLGATLGELDRTDEALAALVQAQASDPASHQTINNIGVLRREMGRLTESEAAFREVIGLAPGQAFGYYNLGHTLFLQGRYRAALSAYGEGQARDNDRNPVQATRLAMCQVATGDAAGALRELQRAVAPLSREIRQQLLADTSAILWALITQQPELTGWQPVQAWVSDELERLA